MSELVNEILPDNEVAVLTGPNLSRELTEGLPGATVIATKSAKKELLLRAFHSEAFRVYLEDDLVGAEFGGAMKNVIAIAAGIADSLSVGNNAKAALLVRGLAEMTRLGQAFGAKPLTFQGLAGAGDLIATAYSPLSRNRLFGEKIGNGLDTSEALNEIGQTVEGLHSLAAVLVLGKDAGVELPICEELDLIISRRKSAKEALISLINRDINTVVR
jgi:glycerol-3-phosphate dehydrogenase (NAD(P)+)